MKKFKSIMLSALISSTLIFTSCNESEPLTGSDITTGPVIIGWAASTVTESYFSDIGTLDNTYNVNVLGTGDGSPTTTDISISLSVDASSTAVEGNEFSLPSSSFTIPAGGTFASVPVNINTGSFDPTSPTTAVINMEASVNGVVVSDLAKQMSITFVGCQSQLASATYNVQITRRSTGGVVSMTSESITELSVNSFQTATVGVWPLSPGVRFTDICGSLYIESHDLADQYSNQVTAAAGPNNLAGTVDANGNFTLTYDISLGAPWGIYDAIYTKQ